MHEVVVTAVSPAVRAAISILISVSQIVLFFMVLRLLVVGDSKR